jgi:hypothetical protein
MAMSSLLSPVHHNVRASRRPSCHKCLILHHIAIFAFVKQKTLTVYQAVYQCAIKAPTNDG